MHDSHFIKTRTLIRRAALLVAIGLLSSPALAQYIGTAPPPPLPAAPRPGEVETPTAALARAVRTLAQSPRDFPALINAGRAAVDLGDTQAAIGFFGRAEEVRPSDPAPKIGMGAATCATGDARGALSWFAQAAQLGASSAAIGADRGLAQDLLGNQAAAQNDYRAALAGPERDEARRRLALSLAISGDRNTAFATIQPLLMRRDPAAQRIRAFILALAGDERGASSAIDSAMPGSGSRMAGFFRLLPSLSVVQKAAAVHLGVFPDPSQIRVAAVSSRILAAPMPQQRIIAAPPSQRVSERPSRRGTRTPVPASHGVRIPVLTFPPVTFAVAPPPVTRPPLVILNAAPMPVAVEPGFSAAGPTRGSVVQAVAAEPRKFNLPSERAAAPPPATDPANATAPVATGLGEASVAATGDRLSGIARLLAQADDLPVPPAPPPRFEKPVEAAVLANTKVSKAAAAKKLANAKKATDAKKADAQREAREAIGPAGINWVQLAGGAHADRMGSEYKRLSGKSSALRKKGGAVTAGKDYFRLLTGPFESKSAAQEFVNQLAKDGIDGFSWTRTPATIKIEKITP